MFLSKPMLGTQLDRSDSLNNPVLDLLMNEGHGDRVNDLSGWGNHGTLHGFDFPPSQTSGWNPGMDGVALTFDGVDDYITVPDSPSLNRTDAITIDVCVKPSSLMAGDGIEGIVQKYSSSGGYMLSFPYGASTKINWILRHGSDSTNLASTYELPLNKWARVVGTFRRPDMRLYINGILNASDSFDYLITDSTTDLQIGRYLKYVDGAIARARILPRAMSAFEVMQTQINPYGAYLQ